MGVKEYKFAGDDRHLLNEYHRQLDSLGEWQINFKSAGKNQTYAFDRIGSGILTVYNDNQKKVLSAYEKEKKMTDGVFYLFFIDNVTDKKDGSGTPVSGYMPRGYNAGFIYEGGSPHTIAHELGHGIAGLEHVFENSNASGKTANLMDYATGEQLWHFQWDQIQDPSRVWMKWNKAEEEGENQLLPDPICLLKFTEAFRRAYAYNEQFLSEPDGYPYFGHRANSITLLDGIEYDHIEKLIIVKANFAPNGTNYRKYTQTDGHVTYSYCYEELYPGPSIGEGKGCFLEFRTYNNGDSFEKYMYPDKKTYDSQIDAFVKIISKNSERDKVLEQLSVLPQQEYSRFTTDVKMRLLSLILREDNPSIKIKCNCVDELDAFINILSAVTEDEYPSLIQTLLGDRYPKLLTYIKNENYSEVMRLLCNAYVRTYYTELDRGYFTNEDLNQPSLNPILDNLSKPKPSYYDFNSVNNKQFKFENGYYTFNGVGWRPRAIINVIGLDNNPEVANILNPKTDFKGTSIVAMPVFFLDFLIKKNNQLDETTKNILRTISLNGALLPIEDIYILATGTDFDGNESDRLVAGGFVALDVIQAGKVFKLAKVKALSKGGRVVNITKRTVLKTITKESLKDITIDICCQFTANLIRNVALSSDIRSRLDFNNCVVKAFEDIDFKGAAKDAIFTATNKGNEKITTALVCAREIMTKLQDDGVLIDKLTDGGINCFLEIPSFFFKQYLSKKQKPNFSNQQLNNALVVFKYYLDSDRYKIIESLIKELPKRQ